MPKRTVFDGKRYTESTRFVLLPSDLWDGEQKNFCTFGEVCAPSHPKAIKTGMRWRGGLVPRRFENDPVYIAEHQKHPEEWDCAIYAKPVEKVFHSLTNLMYGHTHAFLCLDGRVYVRRVVKPFRGVVEY